MLDDDMEEVTLVGGQVLHAHSMLWCKSNWFTNEVCCIHHPSNHHMQLWPQNWRGDRGIMERICPHGIGHPDPDDLKCRKNVVESVHGCDGCCSPK